LLFVAATLFALSGGVATLVNQGARNVALAWVAGISQRLHQAGQKQSADVAGRRNSTEIGAEIGAAVGLLPLPAPDLHGVVYLDTPGPYRASDLTVVGALSIVGDDSATAQILIGEQSFKICAETVRLKNVRIVTENALVGRLSSSAASRLRALVLVESQNLTIEKCLFDSGRFDAELPTNAASPIFAPPTGPALIAWKLLDTADLRGSAATIRNTVMDGDGPALYLAHVVRQVVCENVLKVGPGPFVQLAATPAAKSTVTLKLTRSTLRAAGAVVRWVVPTDDDAAAKFRERIRGTIQVESNDCVFDINSPRAALFELAGTQPRADWLRWLQMTGEGSVTRPTLDVAAWVSMLDGRLTNLDGVPLELEGLIAGEFHFAGKVSDQPEASEVHDSEAPRRSPTPPGIHADTLPSR
jgi:hypothetical protein